MAGRRLLQRLACALFAAAASAQSIVPTNSSSEYIPYSGAIYLQDSNGTNNITRLVPLTDDATKNNLNGELVYASDTSYTNISQSSIAYISCDISDHPGNIQADSILKSIQDGGQAVGAILFSTQSSFCHFLSDASPITGFPVYSTTEGPSAQTVKNDLNMENAATKFFVRVTRTGTATDAQDETQDNQQPNPLGPSPSTAVAMIILYSITGVITALFLVIIVTGAVRAHRHPDRYGPRDVMGRPRQSRARGLGMAILDTIPIVKFGEREPPKPTDVELGSTSETRDANTNADANASSTTDATPAAMTTETRKNDATASAETPHGGSAEHIEGMESGIGPVAGAATAAAAPQESSSANEDEGLGCSICTDDFEKGQDIRVLPCNHKFHPECVDPWLLNVSGTCPLCRVDLRPTTSHSTTTSPSAPSSPTTTLAPPLSTSNSPPRHPHTLRDILSFRSRPNASPDERISALRRLREQRRAAGERSPERGADANASVEDLGRRHRMSVRLSGVFGRGRRGREGSPAGIVDGQQQPPSAAGRDEETRT